MKTILKYQNYAKYGGQISVKRISNYQNSARHGKSNQADSQAEK